MSRRGRSGCRFFSREALPGALFLALAAGFSAAQEIEPIAPEAEAFFAAANVEPGDLGKALARWRVPDLGALPFVASKDGAEPLEGWLLAPDRVLTATYALRRVPPGGNLEAADPAAALRRLLAAAPAPPDVVAAHWVAALQRGDGESASAAWAALVRYGVSNSRGYLHSTLLVHWRTAWDGYERTNLATAALDAAAALARDETETARLRRLKDGLAHTPLQVPAPAPADASPEERAANLVARLRDPGPGVAIIPGGSIVLDAELPRALLALGPAAYPALVGALDHKGLADAWHGNLAVREDYTIGEVAQRILREGLGFLDDRATLDAWIESGAYADAEATGDWFLRNSTRASVREFAARRASVEVARTAFAAAPPQLRAALATRLGDAERREAAADLHRCELDTDARRADALACASSAPLDLLASLLVRGGAEHQAVACRAMGAGGDRAAIGPLAAQLTNDRATRDPAGRVRFVALLSLEALTGENFGGPRDTPAAWEAAVARARAWAADR